MDHLMLRGCPEWNNGDISETRSRNETSVAENRADNKPRAEAGGTWNWEKSGCNKERTLFHHTSEWESDKTRPTIGRGTIKQGIDEYAVV